MCLIILKSNFLSFSVALSIPHFLELGECPSLEMEVFQVIQSKGFFTHTETETDRQTDAETSVHARRRKHRHICTQHTDMHTRAVGVGLAANLATSLFFQLSKGLMVLLKSVRSWQLLHLMISGQITPGWSPRLWVWLLRSHRCQSAERGQEGFPGPPASVRKWKSGSRRTPCIRFLLDIQCRQWAGTWL